MRPATTPLKPSLSPRCTCFHSRHSKSVCQVRWSWRPRSLPEVLPLKSSSGAVAAASAQLPHGCGLLKVLCRKLRWMRSAHDSRSQTHTLALLPAASCTSTPPPLAPPNTPTLRTRQDVPKPTTKTVNHKTKAPLKAKTFCSPVKNRTAYTTENAYRLQK